MPRATGSKDPAANLPLYQQLQRAIREAIELIRRLLAGETVTVKGEQVSFHDGRLDFKPLRADLPIYIAAEGPKNVSLAAEIAENAPLGVAATRATLRAGLADCVAKATEHELAEQGRLRKTADFKEGVQAVAARRMPNFAGQ